MQSKEVSISGSQHSTAGHTKISSGCGVRSKKSAGEGGKIQKRFGGDRGEGLSASANSRGVMGGKGEVNSMVRLS